MKVPLSPLTRVASSTLSTPSQDFDENAVKEIFIRYQGAHWRSTVNITASILGAAILSMPNACMNSGLILFTLLNLLSARISHTTANFLIKTVKYLDLRTVTDGREARYTMLAKDVYGVIGEKIIQFGLMLSLTGACVGHILVIGDVLVPFVPLIFGKEYVDIITQQRIQNLFIWLLMFPITACTRRLSNLGFVSAVAVFAICFFSFTIVFNGIYVLARPDDQEKLLLNVTSIEGPNLLPQGIYSALRAIPLICVSYDMHYNAIPIHEDLKVDIFPPFKSIEVFDETSFIAFLISGFVTYFTGIFGYLTFLSETKSDVLLNFATSGNYLTTIMNFVRILYGIGLALAFPLLVWEIRKILLHFLFKTDQVKDVPYVLVTCFIFLVLTYFGTVSSDLATVYSFIGSCVIPLLDFVFPSILYLRTGCADYYQDTQLPKLILAYAFFLIPLSLQLWIGDHLST